MDTQTVNITFYLLIMLISVAQLCLSVYVLLLMIIRRQIVRENRIVYLIGANIYTAALFSAIFVIDMSAYSIYGQRHMEISFNGWWCRVKGYLMHLSVCTFFHTSTVQAIYRLCRVVYRTRVKLHSFQLYTILSLSLWILTSCELLPSLLIGDIEYVPNDYHCQFAPTSIRGSFTVYFLGFGLPFSVTVFCYIWTMCNIRHQTAALVIIRQQVNMQRDVIILKRLVIFLSIVTIVAAPNVILPIVYIITRSFPSWIIALEWVITMSALLTVSIFLLLISPDLKKLRIGLHVIHPVRTMTVPARQRD